MPTTKTLPSSLHNSTHYPHSMMEQPANGRTQQANHDDPDSRPSFYKIMWPTKLTDLEIPPDFMKNLDNEETDKVTLKSPLGSWEVIVVKEGGDTFLRDGWKEFTEVHSLRHLECVFFKYNGEMCFDVVVYETDGTVRKYKPTEDRESTESSFVSSFPYFKYTIKSYNIGSKGTLLIPVDFSRNYLHLHAPARMLLRSSEGNHWSVNAILNGRQFMISRGWKKFADDNLLKKGDTCVFELVEEDTLQFHIFKYAD